MSNNSVGRTIKNNSLLITRPVVLIRAYRFLIISINHAICLATMTKRTIRILFELKKKNTFWAIAEVPIFVTHRLRASFIGNRKTQS